MAGLLSEAQQWEPDDPVVWEPDDPVVYEPDDPELPEQTEDYTGQLVKDPTFSDAGAMGANQERMWERLATRGVQAGADLLRMGAEQKPPETPTEALLEFADEAEVDADDHPMWGGIKAMSAVPRFLINSISSGVAKGWFDIADIAMGEGDLSKSQARNAVKEVQPIIRSEANRILGNPEMQYQGNAGVKFGWEVAEATVNMMPAIAVGWATRNPGMALGVIGGQVGGETYGRYLEETGDHDKAMAASKFAVAAEVIPETIPVMAILKKTKAGEGMRRFLDASVGEGAQELLTSILTQTYDAKELEGMTLVEAIRNIDWGDALYEGAIGTFVGGALATPGMVGDYLEGRRQGDGPPPETPLADELTPDFEIKSLEENAGAIEGLLEVVPEPRPEGPTDEGAEPPIEFDQEKPGLVPLEQGVSTDSADAEVEAFVEQKKAELGWDTPPEQGPLTDAEVKALPQPEGETTPEGEPWAPVDKTPELEPPEDDELVDDDSRSWGPQGPPAETEEDIEPDITGLADRELENVRAAIEAREKGQSLTPGLRAQFGGQTLEQLKKTEARLQGQQATPPPEAITAEAEQAATSPTNNLPAPTDAQIEAGNYKKGHVSYQGLDISIENPAGSKRRPEWPDLAHHYGYIKGTKGNDGDHVDVFVGPGEGPVFVINQFDKDTGEFDEHKVMLGFESEEAARQGYLANYGPDWVAPDVIPRLSMDEFKQWLESGDMQAPVDADTTQWAKEGKELERRQAAGERQRQRLAPRPEEDDLVTFIRKLGGIDMDKTSDIPEGRFAHLPRVPGLPNMMRRGAGNDLDWLAEQAHEAGFRDLVDEQGNVDSRKLIDQLFRAEDEPIYSSLRKEPEPEPITDQEYQDDALAYEEESRTAQREEEIEKFAGEMAAYVEGELQLSGVNPVTTKLMATAEMYDPQATEDIISKDIPEAEVQELLNALIEDRREKARAAAKAAQQKQQAAPRPAAPAADQGTGRDQRQETGELEELTEPLSLLEFPDAKAGGIRKARTWIHQTDSGKYYYNYDIMSGTAGVSWSPGDPEAAGNAFDTQAEAEVAGLEAIVQWADEQIGRTDSPKSLVTASNKLKQWAESQIEERRGPADMLENPPERSVATREERKEKRKPKLPEVKAGDKVIVKHGDPAQSGVVESIETTGGFLLVNVIGSDGKKRQFYRQQVKLPDEKPLEREDAYNEIDKFDWESLSKETGIEILVNEDPSNDSAMRMYAVDWYSTNQPIPLHHEKTTFIAGAEGRRDAERMFSEAHPGQYFKLWKAGVDADDISVVDDIRKMKKQSISPWRVVETISELEKERGEARKAQLDWMAEEDWVKSVSYREGMFLEPPADAINNFSNDKEYMPLEDAKAELERWKKEAKAQRKEEWNNSQKVILSLFDATGEWAKPWVDAGYDVRAIDLKIDDVDIMDIDRQWLEDHGFLDVNVYGVLAACPCTDFAGSGARDWADTPKSRIPGGKDKTGQTHSSVELVNHTLDIIDYLIPKFWAIENPIGRIKKITGVPEPRLTFNPHNFGDPWTKKTQIYGNFNSFLPTANVEPTEGSLAHKLGSKDEREQGLRSVTPEGFAYAFFMANNERAAPGYQMVIDEYLGSKELENLIDMDRQQIRMGLTIGMHSYEYEPTIRFKEWLKSQPLYQKAYEFGMAEREEDWRVEPRLTESELATLERTMMASPTASERARREAGYTGATAIFNPEAENGPLFKLFSVHGKDLRKKGSAKVTDLKPALKAAGIEHTGKKHELVERALQWKRQADFEMLPALPAISIATYPREYVSKDGSIKYVVRGTWAGLALENKDFRKMYRHDAREISGYFRGSAFVKRDEGEGGGMKTEEGFHFGNKEDAQAFIEYWTGKKKADQNKWRFSRTGRGNFFVREPTGDLFGDDTSVAQQLKELEAKKDAKRSGLDRDEPSLTQAGEDLFNQGGALERDMFYEAPAAPAVTTFEAPQLALEAARSNAGNLADIDIKMSAGDKTVTHNAQFWLDDIEGRILECNKLRDCM